MNELGVSFYCRGGIEASRRLQAAVDAGSRQDAWIAATETGWWLSWYMDCLRRNQ